MGGRAPVLPYYCRRPAATLSSCAWKGTTRAPSSTASSRTSSFRAATRRAPAQVGALGGGAGTRVGESYVAEVFLRTMLVSLVSSFLYVLQALPLLLERGWRHCVWPRRQTRAAPRRSCFTSLGRPTYFARLCLAHARHDVARPVAFAPLPPSAAASNFVWTPVLALDYNHPSLASRFTQAASRSTAALSRTSSTRG